MSGGIYPLLTGAAALAIAVCLALLAVALFMCFSNLGELPIDQKAIGMGLMIVQIVLAIATGFFAMRVFFLLETSLTPKPALVELDDLPVDREYDDTTRPRAVAALRKQAESGADKTLRDWDNNITSQLITELSKMPLSCDRMALCEKFIHKIPKGTLIPESEVNDVLRLFGDVDDGMRVVGMFEPYMKKNEGRGTVKKRSPKSSSTQSDNNHRKSPKARGKGGRR